MRLGSTMRKTVVLGSNPPKTRIRRLSGGRGALPQKMAGVPRSEQHQTNTPSADRPDSSGIVVRERGGLAKGDPAVGGTRPD